MFYGFLKLSSPAMSNTGKNEIFGSEDESLAILTLQGTLPGLGFSAEKITKLETILCQRIGTCMLNKV